jgi:RimJ/RimL family protein N-acetyltransferase
MHLPTRLARIHTEEIGTHFLALADEDRRLRFGRPMNDAALLDYVAKIDFARDAVFGVFDVDLQLIGVGHLARDTASAEIGLSVVAAGRARGVGRSLLERAITHARAYGLTMLYMHCLGENEPMRRLARRAHMSVVNDHGELQAHLELAPRTSGTHLADWVENSMGLAEHAFRVQMATGGYRPR